MCLDLYTVKPVLSGHSKRRPKLVFKTDYHLMQVKGEHSAILLTFIKLPFVIKIFVLSIFEWRLKTGFTVWALIRRLYCFKGSEYEKIPALYILMYREKFYK